MSEPALSQEFDASPRGAARAVPGPLPARVTHPWRLIVVGYAACILVGLACAYFLQHEQDWNAGLAWERAVLLWVRDHPLPQPLEWVLYIVPWFGTNLTLLPVAVLIGLWMGVRHRRWRVGAWLMAVAFGSLTFNALLKHLTARERPDLWERVGWYGWGSYPSGHAIIAVALLGTFALIARWERGWRWTWIPVVFVAVAIVYSRLYHGVHWPTDMIGGVLIGAVWLWVTAMALGRRACPNGGGCEDPPEGVVKAGL